MEQMIAALKQLMDDAAGIKLRATPDLMASLCMHLNNGRDPAANADRFYSYPAHFLASEGHAGVKKRAKRPKEALIFSRSDKSLPSPKWSANPRRYWCSGSFGLIAVGDRMRTPSHV
jgi:hypothetical protein